MQKIFNTKLFFSLGGQAFLFLLFFLFGNAFMPVVKAQSETESFFLEHSYDLYGREQIEAKLVRTSSLVYFYIEQSWWEARSLKEQNDLRIALFELGQEFQNNIYPVLTSTFGLESRPGIDENERITILIHEMVKEVGGYFNSGDVYSRFQSPGSNEREMVYLNSWYIDKPEAKSFLAHEFLHVITVNQKDLLRHQNEETWLNEARAEYAPTLLGYDDTYEGSNLKTRVEDFVASPSDPLAEWLNREEDYGAVNMFIQYIVDQYGINILVDSLQSFQIGIPSINEALQKNGFQKDFAQIFSDWTIAVLVNDCSLGERYCYKNENLIDLRITPASYYLPSGKSIFTTYHTAPYWSANWHRFIGGGQNLALEFNGSDSFDFEVPYVLCDSKDNCSVGFVSLDEEQKGSVTFSEFDTIYSSLTIIPFVIDSTFGLNGNGDSFAFSWQVTGQRKSEVQAKGETELVSELLIRIAELQGQVRQLQAQLAALQGQGGSSIVSCVRFNTNLSFGMSSEQVRCLQEFLTTQGSSIYPERLVTSNFLSLTQQAVVRFQEKYASEILAPLGLERGTGYVGNMTRNKINQIIGGLVVL